MSTLSQFVAIVAIAVGALFQFGRHLEPPMSAANPAAMMRSVNSNDHEMAAMASGWGTGFMTLGGLMLVVPWVNAYVKRHSANAGAGTA